MSLSSRMFSLAILSLFLVSFAAAADVAYVVKSPSHPETNILDSLDDFGLTYDLIDDSQVASTDFAQYEFIVLGDENIDEVPVNEYPSLVLDFGYLDVWAERSGYTTANRAYNLDNDLTEGIEGDFFPYSQSGHKVQYLSYKKNSTAITVKGTSSSELAYYVVAQKTSPRRILFGFSEPTYWSADTKTLFENALLWVWKGGDNDSDGFLLEDDCDDADAAVYPGAEDPSNNCVNDAPEFVDFVEEYIVYRNETVTVELDAYDPEDDALVFNVENSPFTQLSDTTFAWDTNTYPLGEYVFSASVTDGDFASYAGFIVRIVNQLPSCSEIPDISWNEDEEVEINLTAYCSDLDADTLSFGLEETSSSLEIFLYSFIDGIVKLSSPENWFGEDWIVFSVDDGYDTVQTNNVTLVVAPANDAPELDYAITDLSWEEDTNVTLNLAEYFSDLDSSLSYSVTGNANVAVEIENGTATLIPAQDWVGEENVTFIASDGEYEVSANTITLHVSNVNDAPVLQSLSCEENILEDTTYTCEITADDLEDDTLTYNVLSKNKLQCSFSGNTLTYTPEKDYFGNASCELQVSDGSATDAATLAVLVGNVNDGPFIRLTSPTNKLKLLIGTQQEFFVQVDDVDEDTLTYTWLVNNQSVTGDSSFFFTGDARGDYIIEASVNDGNLTDTFSWDVFIASIGDFTCSEMNGHIFKSNEMCEGDVLGVYDTDSCCSIEPTYKFADIERCAFPSDKLEVEIKEPGKGEDFFIDDELIVEVIARHNYDDSASFKVNSYLYDLTNDEIVEDKTKRVKIDDRGKETVEIEFDTFSDYDIDLDDDFAVFAMMTDSDTDMCTEAYVRINLEREDHEVAIDGLSLPTAKLRCDDRLMFSFKADNTGANDEDVTASVGIPTLGLYEEMEEFELESADDTKISYRDFVPLYIPKDAEPGRYQVEFSLDYDDGSEYVTREIEILDCDIGEGSSAAESKLVVTEDPNSVVVLGGEKSIGSDVAEEGGSQTLKLLLLILIFGLVIFVVQLTVKMLSSNAAARSQAKKEEALLPF